MEPTLLIGDRIFVSKYSYGYSKHSFPFSPNIYNKRLFYKEPKRGDLVVFKTPADNRTDYIKRLVGLPGDTIQFQKGKIFLNDVEILRKKLDQKFNIRCGPYKFEFNIYEEILPNGTKYLTAYKNEDSYENSDKFVVPKNHFFFLGDNRDCSKDSRYLNSPGYVNKLNLVGKASMIFFSNDTITSSAMKFWNWGSSMRVDRFFNKL